MWGPEAAGADVSQAGSEQVGTGKAQEASLVAGSYDGPFVRCSLAPKDTLHVPSPCCLICVSGAAVRVSSGPIG